MPSQVKAPLGLVDLELDELQQATIIRKVLLKRVLAIKIRGLTLWLKRRRLIRIDGT